MPRLSSCLFALCLAIPVIALTQDSGNTPASPSAAAYQSNPKYMAAIAEAKKCIAQRQFTFAVDAYKKANKIAGGQDPKSLQAIFDLQLSMGEYKDAVATATHLDEIAITSTEKASAEVNRGQALLLQAGEKGKPELIQAAETFFKAAIVNDPKTATPITLKATPSPASARPKPPASNSKNACHASPPKIPAISVPSTSPKIQHFPPQRWRPPLRS
jgi:hypothetical protein